jgi:hypothetical protein
MICYNSIQASDSLQILNYIFSDFLFWPVGVGPAQSYTTDWSNIQTKLIQHISSGTYSQIFVDALMEKASRLITLAVRHPDIGYIILYNSEIDSERTNREQAQREKIRVSKSAFEI